VSSGATTINQLDHAAISQRARQHPGISALRRLTGRLAARIPGAMRRLGGPLVLGAVLAGSAAAQVPSCVFILLDTTRADRFGALGHARATTPHLDALAASGVLFRRHFANAHATRPSMPQLMSGRYYHANILRTFTPNEHPREFPFIRRSTVPTLLPGLLRAAGYRAVGVSAHPWVTAESAFGRDFDSLELVSFAPSDGHGDAAQVVDRALELWRAREPNRPLFLYLHLMDMHMPRRLPEGDTEAPVPGFDWRRRFSAGSEPLFDRERRRWMRSDASDFTTADREHFAAVYDRRLAYTDAHLGRLLAALRTGDPELRDTLVVVTADHGEELGEDGRIDHGDSLADGVQHIPWIMAGVGIVPGQQTEQLTENIDVLPTVLAAIGVPAPAARLDGRAQLTASGAICTTCGKAAVYYVWEDYRGVRHRGHLLRQRPRGSLAAHCAGENQLYRLDGERLTPIALDGSAGRLPAQLARRATQRLGKRERAFARRRYDRPVTSFVLRPAYWSITDPTAVRCLPVGPHRSRASLGTRGWLWSGRGVSIMRRGRDTPLPVVLRVPPGSYQVDAVVVSMGRVPWFFGFERWRRRAFLVNTPSQSVRLGSFHTATGRVEVPIPPAVAEGRHVVGLRLIPPGGDATSPRNGATDHDQIERLRALGYVE
jgi:arylsulfatase A-like enzyme